MLTAGRPARRRRRTAPGLSRRGQGVRAVRHRRSDEPAGAPLSRQSSLRPDPRARGRDRRGAPRAGPGESSACSTETSPSGPASGRASAPGSATPGPPASPASRSAGWSFRARMPRSILPSTGPARGPISGNGACRPGGKARWRRTTGYAMVEWARTSEAEGFFVFTSRAGGRCMDPGPPPSPLSVRADRAAGGGARVRVPLPSAAPGELDPRDQPLEHPHGGVRPPASGAPWSHGGAGGRGRLTGGSPGSGVGSSTSTICTVEHTSGAGPWGSG